MSFFSGWFGGDKGESKSDGGSTSDDRTEEKSAGKPTSDSFLKAADATSAAANCIPVGPMGNITSVASTAGHIANEGMTEENVVRTGETLAGMVCPPFAVAEGLYNTSTLFTGGPSSTELLGDAYKNINEKDADKVAKMM